MHARPFRTISSHPYSHAIDATCNCNLAALLETRPAMTELAMTLTAIEVTGPAELTATGSSSISFSKENYAKNLRHLQSRKILVRMLTYIIMWVVILLSIACKYTEYNNIVL